MEMAKYKLGDIVTLLNGRAYLMPELQDSGKYRILRVGNLSGGNDSWYYSDMELDENKYCENGDLLYAWACNFGPHIWREEKVIYHYHIWKLVENKEKVDRTYLYYYLLHQTPFYLGGVNGATMVHITKKNMEKKTVYIPSSLNVQHRIASILSTYDSLIENNTKRIRLLEKMAENIYKEWFVRFRFPGHENVEMENSKYGKLPKTFEIVKMNEVFDYYIGGGWGEEERSEGFPEEASVIRGADFPNIWYYDVSSCPKRYHKAKNYKARQLEDGDIIMEISGGTSEQPVGRTVLVTEDLLERFPNKRLICASFCKLIRLKKDVVSPYYFYYWMKFLYDTRIIDRFQLQSTGIINFKFELFLRRGDVVLPPKEVMLAFEKQVSLCHKEMNQLAKQNSLLARQRDLLLPRLMSGKLEVKEELLE